MLQASFAPSATPVTEEAASAESHADGANAKANATANAERPDKALPAAVAAKRDLVRGAQSGRANWGAFQAAVSGGRRPGAAVLPRDDVVASSGGSFESERSGTADENARPPPVSFKLGGKPAGKSKKAGGAGGYKTVPVPPLPLPAAAYRGGPEARVKQGPVRRRVVVLDTSAWIDEADRALTPAMMLQGLVTTQVTLVLPEQVHV